MSNPKVDHQNINNLRNNSLTDFSWVSDWTITSFVLPSNDSYKALTLPDIVPCYLCLSPTVVLNFSSGQCFLFFLSTTKCNHVSHRKKRLASKHFPKMIYLSVLIIFFCHRKITFFLATLLFIGLLTTLAPNFNCNKRNV